MVTYAAVVTTGIYCRPGCGARPNRGNIRQFPLAAAAEAAGYRACMRCRPYRVQPPVSLAGPELVCRAVQLILDGALDRTTEDKLGARLGISARQLRRLFAEYLGVTPGQLARSGRVHFARRMLDDTDLRIADVAFAAGFGSVRQFNRDCQQVFRASPAELRARRRVSDRLAADGGLALRMPFQPPLDWDAMLSYLESHAIEGVEHVQAGSYRRTVIIDGDPGVLELAPGGPEHLILRAHLPHWQGLIHVVQRARHIFNLDADVETAAKDLAADPIVAPHLALQPGMRPPGTWDPFEIGVQAIAGQRTSPAATRRLMRRLVERYGIGVPGLRALGLTHLFPAPARLAEAELSGLGMAPSRAATIRAFAGAVASEAISFDRADRLKALIGSIMAIPGVDCATAQYLAFRLGEPDAFPCAEPGLLRALSRALGEPLTPDQADQVADRWQPWRAYAAQYLLRHGGHADQQGPDDEDPDVIPRQAGIAGG